MLDFSQFQLLTFDCYGTLIDWETGLLGALRPVIAAHQKHVSDVELLRLFGELEAEAESGVFKNYREVLATVVTRLGQRLGFRATDDEVRRLPESVQTWQPFPDTVSALRRLKSRYRLAIISNVDDDMFAATAQHLEIKFDGVITAQQARSYKPEIRIFEVARERLHTLPQHTLHIAQSIYHDIVPAKHFNLTTVWMNRSSANANIGAVRPAVGEPDLELRSLDELATLAGV